MSNFKIFQQGVQNAFTLLQNHPLFKVDLDRDEVIQTYLNAFPPGTNSLYREQTEHDCSCCKQFLRTAGGIVAITPHGVKTLWEMDINDPTYQAVADVMHQYVLSKSISNAFHHYEGHIGTHHNFEALDVGQQRWDHFHVSIPSAYVVPKDTIDTRLGKIRTNQEMHIRAMYDLSLDAIQTVVDLIAQNAIYRGEEFKTIVKEFRIAYKHYHKLKLQNQNNQSWLAAVQQVSICRFKNSVIGTLVSDLSTGVDLTDAVKLYESKVAPENYKRTTALITPKMIENAQKTVEAMGIADALYRRYAVTEDLTINNVLFADRKAKKHMGVFEGLNGSIKPARIKNLDKVQDVPIDKFITDIVPNVDSIEVMFEGRHKNNLMSVIAPVTPDAPSILKWNNNFSWSYNGEVTDSIKERVKRAGGNVDGDLRFSLSWFNTDDLDLHAYTPDEHIYFGNRRTAGGCLDVDMNVSRLVTDPVENITWDRKDDIAPGEYHIYVNQFTKRNKNNVGFIVEMEFMGEKQQFQYDKEVSNNVTVCKFNYSTKNGITIKESLSSDAISETIWNLSTQQFHKVKLLMHSPNHWDNQTIGNKHHFFILDQCQNDNTARGFYNEFLNPALIEHRKVFEVLSAKITVPESDKQLSGLGFSSTKPDHLLCKLSGNFNRTVKVIF